jgi:hypothetical protein
VAEAEPYQDRYERFSALHQLSRDTDFLAIHVMSGASGERFDAVIDALADEGANLGLDQARFKRLLRNHVSARGSGKKPTGKLYEYLNAEIAAARKAVGELLGGRGKAIAFLEAIVRDASRVGDTDYEAYTYLGAAVEESAIERVADHWRTEWEKSRPSREADPGGSEVFWISLDFQETPDLVAHLRFYEAFGLGEFELVFRDALNHIGEALLEHANALGPFDVRPRGGFDIRAAAFELWLASRVAQVRYELQDTLLLALRALVRRQNSDGSWPSEVGVRTDATSGTSRLSFGPDNYSTALACVVLLKLGSSEEHAQVASRGVLWLLKQQSADGSWSDNVFGEGAHGDLLTTLLAMEATLRSGNTRTASATDRAAKWIYARQDDLGGWFEGRFPSPLLTVLILEALDLRDATMVQLNAYLESAVQFLIRARRLIGDGLEASAPLAVVSAHHGVEAFLYGLLTLPQTNKPIWEKGGTIGARAALRKLEEELKTKKIIRRDEVIGRRNELDRLFDFRDQVVHKAIRVSEADARTVVNDAVEFVREQSLRELGVDIVDAA